MKSLIFAPSSSSYKYKRPRCDEEISFASIKRLSIQEPGPTQQSSEECNDMEEDFEPSQVSYDADTEPEIFERQKKLKHPFRVRLLEDSGEFEGRTSRLNLNVPIRTCFRRKVDWITDELVRKSLRRNSEHPSNERALIPLGFEYGSNGCPNPMTDLRFYRKSQENNDGYISDDFVDGNLTLIGIVFSNFNYAYDI